MPVECDRAAGIQGAGPGSGLLRGLEQLRNKEKAMHSRRQFVAVAAGIERRGPCRRMIAPDFTPMAAAAEKAGSSSDGTWLTYAVNVEMTWGKLPFLDRLRKVKEAGFSHYEFWPWRNKDHRCNCRLEPRARADDLRSFRRRRSRVSATGSPIPTRPAASEFEEEIRIGGRRRQETRRQEALRGGRRGDARATRATNKPRPSSPRSRPGPRSSSPRASRSSSSRSTCWSIIPASSSCTRRTPPRS